MKEKHTCNHEEDFKELYQTRDLVILINERQQRHDEVLNEILNQVKYTNGRVRKLETFKKTTIAVGSAITFLLGVQWIVATYILDKIVK